MCKQKTDRRVYLEEYLKRHFSNQSYEIEPYHFNEAGNFSIEPDLRVCYFGALSIGDMNGNEIFYFDKAIRYVGDNNDMFFGSFSDFIDVAFVGYRVSFELTQQLKPK